MDTTNRFSLKESVLFVELRVLLFALFIAGVYTKLRIESDEILWILSKDKPTNVLNPCGHAIDEMGAKYWTRVTHPAVNESICQTPSVISCPFCRTILASNNPFSKLRYQTENDEDEQPMKAIEVSVPVEPTEVAEEPAQVNVPSVEEPTQVIADSLEEGPTQMATTSSEEEPTQMNAPSVEEPTQMTVDSLQEEVNAPPVDSWMPQPCK